MQGLGALIGIPMSNDILNGSCLLLAALSLILGDRFHAHLKELKKHEEHLRVRYGKKISEICIGNIFFFSQKYHQNPDQNCHSIIIHDENVENQGDEDVIAESDEDDDDTHIHDSILELYKNRHKSPEAFAQWQQLEQELFKKDAIKVEPIEENPVKPPIGIVSFHF